MKRRPHEHQDVDDWLLVWDLGQLDQRRLQCEWQQAAQILLLP